MDTALLIAIPAVALVAALVYWRAHERRLWRLRLELAQEDAPTQEAVEHLMRGR